MSQANHGTVLISCHHCGGTWGYIEEPEPLEDRLRQLSSIATKPKLIIICGMCGRDVD